MEGRKQPWLVHFGNDVYFIFGTGILVGLESPSRLGRLASEPQIPLAITSPVQGLQMYTTTPGFLKYGFGN